MANQPNPSDPYDRDHLQDPLRSHLGESDPRSPSEIDNELQVDPEMAEGPASNSRTAMFAVGIAIVLGVAFYALNNSSLRQQASTVPTPTNSQSSSSQSSSSTALPAAPPGMRDVTPHSNTQPGTTTGNAPAKKEPNRRWPNRNAAKTPERCC